jgi:YfiH family protein
VLRRRESGGAVFYESPLLAALGLRHAFSTRLGGISAAPFDSLNLGNPNGCPVQDDRERIAENYRRLLAAIGAEQAELLRVHQVHGAAVATATAGRAFDVHQQADAIITGDPNRVLSVRIADCVPILLASEDGSIVAAVHAGWRGVIAEVARHAIAAMAVPPAKVVAAIGPCIGFDAFEVGPEVLTAFSGHFGAEAAIRRRADGKGHVDLAESVRRQLIAAGVPEDRIDTTDRCTFRDAGEFFSHRRETGVTGRMAALIAPLAAD